MLTIVASGQGNTTISALKSLYGVSRLPEIRRLNRAGRLGMHLFNLKASILARRYGAGLVLSRSIGAAAITARLGLPTVFECHGPPNGGERLYWSILANSKNFHRLVVISDALRNIMVADFPIAKHTSVIVAHDGVDLAQFASMSDARSAKIAARRNPNRPVAGYAGHLYAGRGIEVILACAAALSHWDFVIAGGEETDIANLRSQITERNIKNIEIIGFIPNSQLKEKFAIADVLLMPYQRSVMISSGILDTSGWMSPLKMFEYMAMNRAIIASDLPVLREVLNENVARLVEPTNPACWIEALKSLESSSKRTPLAENAMLTVQQFDWGKRIDRMLKDLPLPAVSAVKTPLP